MEIGGSNGRSKINLRQMTPTGIVLEPDRDKAEATAKEIERLRRMPPSAHSGVMVPGAVGPRRPPRGRHNCVNRDAYYSGPHALAMAQTDELER
jgi:hypothetical protein